MPNLPSPDALRVVVAVDLTGSISGAADELGITQQAASRRIHALETTLGVRLLERTSRGSALTDAGHLVARRGADALAALDTLLRELDGIGTGARAPLTIAASLTIAEHLVPRWLVAYRETADPAPVTLASMNSVAVADAVRSRAAEVGFIETTRQPTGLAIEHLADDELIAVVAPDDPWATREDPLPWRDLAARPGVVRESGSGTRHSLDDLLRRAGVPTSATPAAEVSSAAAVRAGVAAGLGHAVLSRRAVADDLRLGRLVQVPLEQPLLRPLSAVSRAGEPLSPAARAFLAVARADLRTFG